MLHHLGAAYGRLPSAILGVEDGWAAYQLDCAALLVGRTVERLQAEGDEVEGYLGSGTLRPFDRSTGSRLTAQGAVGQPQGVAPTRGERGGFRSVNRDGLRKVQVGDDGLW